MCAWMIETGFVRSKVCLCVCCGQHIVSCATRGKVHADSRDGLWTASKLCGTEGGGGENAEEGSCMYGRERCLTGRGTATEEGERAEEEGMYI